PTLLSTTEWLPDVSPVKVTLALIPIVRLVVPSRLAVYPSGSRSPLAPLVAVVTLRLPVVGPVGAQLIENVVLAVPPAGTDTVRGVAPLTVQFLATPLSAIE